MFSRLLSSSLEREPDILVRIFMDLPFRSGVLIAIACSLSKVENHIFFGTLEYLQKKEVFTFAQMLSSLLVGDAIHLAKILANLPSNYDSLLIRIFVKLSGSEAENLAKILVKLPDSKKFITIFVHLPHQQALWFGKRLIDFSETEGVRLVTIFSNLSNNHPIVNQRFMAALANTSLEGVLFFKMLVSVSEELALVFANTVVQFPECGAARFMGRVVDLSKEDALVFTRTCTDLSQNYIFSNFFKFV